MRERQRLSARHRLRELDLPGNPRGGQELRERPLSRLRDGRRWQSKDRRGLALLFEELSPGVSDAHRQHTSGVDRSAACRIGTATAPRCARRTPRDSATVRARSATAHCKFLPSARPMRDAALTFPRLARPGEGRREPLYSVRGTRRRSNASQCHRRESKSRAEAVLATPLGPGRTSLFAGGALDGAVSHVDDEVGFRDEFRLRATHGLQSRVLRRRRRDA